MLCHSSNFFNMKKIDLIEAVSKEIKITRSEAKHSVEIILDFSKSY